MEHNITANQLANHEMLNPRERIEIELMVVNNQVVIATTYLFESKIF